MSEYDKRQWSNDNKSKPEGLKCQTCGYLTYTAEEYEEHKLTHPEDGEALRSTVVDEKVDGDEN